MLFLNNDMRIKRYNTSVTRAVNLIETDIGRPVSPGDAMPGAPFEPSGLAQVIAALDFPSHDPNEKLEIIVKTLSMGAAEARPHELPRECVARSTSIQERRNAMMNRDEFLRRHPDLQPDLVAVSDDGTTLGAVTSLNENSVDIARGDFFPRDFAVSYDDIGQANDGRLVLNRSGDDLNAWKDPDYEGWRSVDELNKGTEVDIMLREELLETQTSMRQAGQVRLRKVVRTEEKTFTVPVAREEVHVEHIQMNEPVAEGQEEQAFSEQEITIPVMEEQVEVVKRLRIKGRVHAKKAGVIEQQQVSGSVRTEDVEVVREGPREGGGESRGAGGDEGFGEEGYES